MGWPRGYFGGGDFQNKSQGTGSSRFSRTRPIPDVEFKRPPVEQSSDTPSRGAGRRRLQNGKSATGLPGRTSSLVAEIDAKSWSGYGIVPDEASTARLSVSHYFSCFDS